VPCVLVCHLPPDDVLKYLCRRSRLLSPSHGRDPEGWAQPSVAPAQRPG
jgi:hypothetical protein